MQNVQGRKKIEKQRWTSVDECGFFRVQEPDGGRSDHGDRLTGMHPLPEGRREKCVRRVSGVPTDPCGPRQPAQFCQVPMVGGVIQ